MSPREPDVEIAASFKAEELRFECTPRTRVVAHADVPAVAESHSERDNLPEPVEPGVTYRDVAVRWRASVRLAEDPVRPSGR